MAAGFCGSRSVDTDLGSKTGQSMIILVSFANHSWLATMGLLGYPQHDHFLSLPKHLKSERMEEKHRIFPSIWM